MLIFFFFSIFLLLSDRILHASITLGGANNKKMKINAYLK